MPLTDGCVRVPRQSASNARHFKSTWPQVCRPVHRPTFLCRVRHSMHAHRPTAYRHDPRGERRRLCVLTQVYLYIFGALQAINLLCGLLAPRRGRVCRAAVAPWGTRSIQGWVPRAGSRAGLLSRVVLPRIPPGGGCFPGAGARPLSRGALPETAGCVHISRFCSRYHSSSITYNGTFCDVHCHHMLGEHADSYGVERCYRDVFCGVNTSQSNSSDHICLKTDRRVSKPNW